MFYLSIFIVFFNMKLMNKSNITEILRANQKNINNAIIFFSELLFLQLIIQDFKIFLFYNTKVNN